jgi:hypothetical protein
VNCEGRADDLPDCLAWVQRSTGPKIICISRRAAEARWLSFEMSFPSNRIVPAVGP